MFVAKCTHSSGRSNQISEIEEYLYQIGSKICQYEIEKCVWYQIFCRNIIKTQILCFSDGAVVDPDSGLDDIAHVYSEGKLKYFAILGKVDIQNDKNSYYKLQLLESDSKQKKKYWIFRSWGRISTTIGSKQIEDCGSLEAAIRRFKELYTEKSKE